MHKYGLVLALAPHCLMCSKCTSYNRAVTLVSLLTWSWHATSLVSEALAECTSHVTSLPFSLDNASLDRIAAFDLQTQQASKYRYLRCSLLYTLSSVWHHLNGMCIPVFAKCSGTGLAERAIAASKGLAALDGEWSP